MTDNVTINTHSSIRIDAGKLVIYVDPFEIEGEPHDANVILVTHEHRDHFSPEDIRKIFKEEDTFVIAPVVVTRNRPEPPPAPLLPAPLPPCA